MQALLDSDQLEAFIHTGFIRINNAFSTTIAEKARQILWQDTGCDPNDPQTWTKPVVRLGMYTQEPFIQAANTAILHQAFDQLVGKERWVPCTSMGSFPIRFPSAVDPGDGGWHVDASFPGADPGNYFDWRINVRSKGRGLLMLFLFSDVGERDAPTRIRVGSHLDVARMLQPAGEEGLSFMELAQGLPALPAREEILATGEAGTVYCCHPFLVHAAQPHHGTVPRFMAQPPLLLRHDLVISGPEEGGSPVEQAIRMALE
ncbi:phytanoyl-CoA dioxygenase [Paraflavitalea soli]|uniref:Phytanoyl-CoA dioxygenase n=1 Tax=Paraflavitalea soli TaxID=2315862 RepID=A0A3B7MMQ1_9BACT|nr:phytanoyl-CoA dioxygenase family protein [Paraflavitalea soli]AXY74583.1 phytanoyl-CoA dioxygenase [Paraflavitalea soli]